MTKSILIKLCLNQEHQNTLKSNCKHVPADGLVHAQTHNYLKYWGGDRKNVTSTVKVFKKVQ